jgi:ABC-2 type transport system ATP-binding protein
MSAIVSVRGLTKTYASGTSALSGVDLDIEQGEILALLGPNGAGKTTMIGIICGIVRPSAGTVTVGGHDIITDWRAARRLIGLVPQDVALEAFETVAATVTFSRGLAGMRRDPAVLERVLKQLSLWDKKDAKVSTLSGGMKRRVLIAKALIKEPRVLFLDEPTAGVDVELRRDMWETVRALRAAGTTVILTTHYIEEAEALADRVGVIAKGRILLVEKKTALMARMGRKELHIALAQPLTAIPDALARPGLTLAPGGRALIYSYDKGAERTGIGTLVSALPGAGVQMADLSTRESSLEDIFVDLVHQGGQP